MGGNGAKVERCRLGRCSGRGNLVQIRGRVQEERCRAAGGGELEEEADHAEGFVWVVLDIVEEAGEGSIRLGSLSTYLLLDGRNATRVDSIHR